MGPLCLSVKMLEPICMTFGILKHCVVLNKSVKSILNKSVK